MPIDRRGLMLTGAAGLLVGLPQWATAQTLTSQNTVTWFGKSLSEHNGLVGKWAPKGFRSITSAIYDNPSAPLFAAAMTLRPQIVTAEEYPAVSKSSLQGTITTEGNKGLGLYVLSATGPDGSQVYDAIFTPMSPLPHVQLDLSASEFDSHNNTHQAAGRLLIAFDVFGDAGNPRYCAVWGANPSRYSWACTSGIDNTGMDKQRFAAQTAAGCRPLAIAQLGPEQSIAAYTDAGIGDYTYHLDMDNPTFQSIYNSETAAGRQPVRIAGGGSGSNARLAAIFATHEAFDPIVTPVRSNGPLKDANIDNAVAAFMTEMNFKGMSLAVCNGTKLVYARGYTNAESWYPDVTPTTSFRQASISKFFTAGAWQRVIQNEAADSSIPANKKMTLQTKVQDILNLTPPPGLTLQADYKKITLQNLMESVSGLNQNLIYSGPQAAAAFGHTTPGTMHDLISYIATQPMTGTPGDKTNVVYGNVDYTTLGLALMTHLGKSTAEDAIRSVLLGYLNIGASLRRARTKVSDQPSGEARYHLRTYDHNSGDWQLDPLHLDPTVMSSAGELAADQYGDLAYETFESAGGLSASAVDVARLAACLSCRTNNPAFTNATIDAWMKAAANCTSTYSGPDAHGYYGLDWLDINDPTNHVYQGSKGGWLPSHQSIVNFTTGSFTLVFLWNGNTHPSPPAPAKSNTSYITDITNAVLATGANLSTGDLFASSYNMTSFPTGLSAMKLGPFKAIDLDAIETQQKKVFVRARGLARKPAR